MSRRLRIRAGVVAAVAALVVVSCGIPPQGKARRIDPADVPFRLLEEDGVATETGSGQTDRVYLVSGERLVGVDRVLPSDATLADLLEVVVDGPTEVEQTLGITSSVPAGTVASVATSRGVAVVELTAAFGDVRGAEQGFALGQIVYTLTGQPGIGGVAFTLDGEPVEVPLEDGLVSDEPLARDDFGAIAPS